MIYLYPRGPDSPATSAGLPPRINNTRAPAFSDPGATANLASVPHFSVSDLTRSTPDRCQTELESILTSPVMILPIRTTCAARST
jgi:hypothetical protein